jgi:hypothetical protein
MEQAFANFSTPLVTSLQLLKTDLSKIFQQADNASLVADQSRSDLALSLEQSSSVVTATNIVSVEVPSTGDDAGASLPASAVQAAGALAGGKQ